MNYDILQYLVSLEIMQEPVVEEDLDDLETLEKPMEPDALC